VRVSATILSFSATAYLRRGPVRRPKRSVLFSTEVSTSLLRGRLATVCLMRIYNRLTR
jgi:hypothetical protein